VAEQAVSQLKSVRPRISVPSVAALRARAWMVGPPLLFGLVGVLIAVGMQGTTWHSKAEVRFNVANIMAPLTATTFLPSSPTYTEVQARLARSPALAARVVRDAHVSGLTATKFLRHSSATPVSDADVLDLSVIYRPRATAVRLANLYATEFVRLKCAVDLQSIDQALRRLQRRLRGRDLHEPRYTELLGAQSALKVFRDQLRNSTSVYRRADGASSFRPHALRNGLIGGALGVLLGVALVGVVSRRLRR
jgi:hypothetical protein